MEGYFVRYRTLPLGVQAKIPLTLRCNSGEDGKIYLENLPLYLISMLDDYKELEKEDDELNQYIYELIPNLSLKNDFTVIDNKKEAIVHFLKNYIYCSRGGYPFIPEEGNLLKEQLFAKNDYIAELILTEELDKICGSVSAFYDVPVKILNKEIVRSTSDDIAFDFELRLTVQVKDEVFNV
jgi:hypothetical protein